jgi:hypothetical protein
MTLSKYEARRLADEAVRRSGGARYVYTNPRHPFSRNANRRYEIDGHTVTVRIGESSAPAIVEVGEYIYEIREDELIELFGPRE